MSVDFEAIAQRGRCEVSSLRLALPLLEQGYTPPFLARYRRDELGGLDESSLWALSSALKIEQQVASRRDELHGVWERTSLRDPAIGHAIDKSNSIRMLARLGRRLKSEVGDNISDATRLAVRVLNPHKGDGNDFAAIAAKVEGITDAAAAVADLDHALAKRLAGDPRIIAAAVRWLVKNARIHIVSINDPHTSASHDQPKSGRAKKGKQEADDDAAATPESTVAASAVTAPQATESQATESQATEPQATGSGLSESVMPEPTASDSATLEVAATETAPEIGAASTAGDVASITPEATVTETTASEITSGGESEVGSGETSTAETAEAPPSPGEPASTDEPAPTSGAAPSDVTTSEVTGDVSQQPAAEPAKSASKGSKNQKKISPRQRRRRWLVSVLKPLAGKRFNSDKLSSFQVVMLGRALRSQVAECSFEYDATKLVAELQRTAGGINRQIDQRLREIVLKHEAAIREAAESAWWDDLQERASARLVTITADHLRRHINRGGVEAKVVMSIDAIGPRTAATAIVSSDGRLLHCEDLACQLSSSLRARTVTKMGELIHTYHVDLIVISNGPARRGSMIALGDLIAQSPENSVRWTLADRSGADAYASSGVADQEMRSTPRRFRAAAWLAFSVLQPAQALAKVDPLKLRLSSFQRELSDEAMSRTLEDVMVSGASRGGVDVNSAPASWLSRLPGMSAKVAEAIDVARREALFESREAVVALEQWESTTQSRQAVPFLRVFGSQEVLDGTLVHPEDYPLAKKLATALEIELPPDAPPGYVSPDFTAHEPPAEPDQLSEAEPRTETKIEVEDFSSAGDKAADFSVDATTDEPPQTVSEAASEESIQTRPAAEPEAPEASSAEASAPEPAEPVATEPEASGESAGQASEENLLEPSDSADSESGDGPAAAEPDAAAESEPAPATE